MLAIFPQLLSFSLFAPLMLRLVVGLVFVVSGIRHVVRRSDAMRTELARIFPWAASLASVFGIAECVLGVLLVAGLWTQIVAIVAGIGSLKLLFFKRRFSFTELTPYSVGVYALLAVISFSILVTGPGFFAFDLPL